MFTHQLRTLDPVTAGTGFLSAKPVKSNSGGEFHKVPFMGMLSAGDILSLNKAGTCYCGFIRYKGTAWLL
jgi:hypothetical protein